MRIVFKNIHTKDKVIKSGESYRYLLNNEILNEGIRASVVEQGQDWEMVEPDRDIYIKGKNHRGKDFFKSFITGTEYHPGDDITIDKNMKFSDGRRDFFIKGFDISDKPNAEGAFQFVYVRTACGRSIHLSDVIIKH